MIGTRLAHYEITSHIGSGGMGDVYQATDTKLGRSVAIKFLPEGFSHDTERVARFQREARVLAALNHSNIAAIHGLEEIDSRHFLVMELVSGETLADRIKRGAIPIEEALPIAKQIADALEEAHEKGIIHRDLKPANIKLTLDGNVKVLDFGLAKAWEREQMNPALSHSPTISVAATNAGIILGTAAYMSPEQAKGRPVDKRADIWAFGCVVYEMLTGKRAFEGEDVSETLAAVMRDKPDLSTVPAEVRRVLEKCLEKDPKKRLRDISGVQLLLESVTPALSAEAQPQGSTRSHKWPFRATVAVAVALAALAGIAVVHFRETTPEAHAVMFSMDPPPGLDFANQYGAIAPSPDGRYVVFAAAGKTGTPSLWLRPLDSLAARPLPGTEAGNFPTWSPDGKSLVFQADNKLKRIEITGGAPLTLCDVVNTRTSPTGTWNRDGVILFGSPDGLHRVSASGGGATLLTKVDSPKESGHGYPQFLPDGNHFIYFVESSDPNVQGVYSSSLRNPAQRQQIVRTAAKAVYVLPRDPEPGYLLWMQDQTLVAQRFNENNLTREGDPVSVAEQIGLNPAISIRAAYWASDSGLLVYFQNASAAKRPLVWLNTDGKQVEAAPEDNYAEIALAPGQGRVAVAREEMNANNYDIWVREFERGVMTRLTFNAAQEHLPLWSPDGKQVVFASNRDGAVVQIYRKDASGTGMEERLTDGPTNKFPLDWSKDGKYLLYREDNPSRGRDLMALPLEGVRKPVTVVSTTSQESTGAISPDGRWVAYASNDSGAYQLYVQAFPNAGGPAGRWQVSNGGAYDVRWRGDGKELYYQTLDNSKKMMAVAIQTGPEGVRAETPRVLFSADYPNGFFRTFDVTPNGKRFLLILDSSQETATQQLTVITNWQAALRK
jgi:eukaryotic-like serine/threonine-protein kinase